MSFSPAGVELALKILGAAGGLFLVVLGAGRAWGVVTTELRGTRHMMEKLHERFDGFRQEVRADLVKLNVSSARLETRVEVVERLVGLPPPWKRTQPIPPLDVEEK